MQQISERYVWRIREARQYIPHFRCWVVFVVTCGVTVSPCLTTAHLCP